MDRPSKEARIARWQARRATCLATAGGGIALLFAGRVWVQAYLGGAIMVLGGLAAAAVCGWNLRRLKGDPWAYDPDLDGPDPDRPRDPGWRDDSDDEETP